MLIFSGLKSRAPTDMLLANCRFTEQRHQLAGELMSFGEGGAVCGVIPELTCLDCGTRAAAEDSGNDAGEDESRDDAAAEDPVQIGFPADDKGE